MKKIIALLIVLAMTFMMAACGGGTAEEAKDVDLHELYELIFEKCSEQSEDQMVLFEEENEDIISDMYPGFYDIETEEFLLNMHPIAGTGCEVMLVKVKDAADVSKMMDVMEERIAKGTADTFYPENSGTWKNNSMTASYGNYVILVCMPIGIELPEEAIKAAFN